MSTETKSENTTPVIDKKALFGPLGRYAIIGVIMGSIIVTTAIMLDRQSDSAIAHIEAIEKELAELNAAEAAATADTTTVIEADNSQLQEVIDVAEVNVIPVNVEAATVQTDTIPTTASVEKHVSKQQVVMLTTDTVATTQETAFDTNQTIKQKPASTQTVNVEPAKNEATFEYTAQTYRPQHVVDLRDQQWEARIRERKLEQKQHLAELFNRNKAHDLQRLEEYKVWQEEGVDIRRERLREQIARQQELIEELILRNKEAYEMREASVQRQQTSHKQLLDRI